ncbi:MAG: hypothetical protein AMS27_04195 [Bacteroides sp. SM23_62_1]|nr:MAG: hypothetical protein AMS27_04195 [Bacteroides sp. SM23_62_1]
MFHEFSTFSVEINDDKYTRDDGVVFSQTAVLKFISPDGHYETKLSAGYASEDYIMSLIREGRELNLDRCYIDHLSLESFRQEKDLDRKTYVEIAGFSAKDSFINNKYLIDLSYAHFTSGTLNFENSYFAKNALTLHASKITNGGLDFHNAHLPDGDLNFTNLVVEGTVDFKNVKFGRGSKDFQDASFGEGDILFVNADFNDGDVSFVNTQFGSGNISFKVARFGTGRVDFHFAKVGEGDISFERTEFGNGRVDFRTVEFGTGRVNFNRAIFGNGDVSFEASQIKEGKISFTKAEFGEGNLSFELAEFDHADASFDRADFNGGNISFHNARFRSLGLTSCHLNHYTDLRVAVCPFMDLSDTVARDIIDLKPYEFDIRVDTINFSGMRLLGRIFIDWEKNHVKKLIMSQRDTSKRIKAEQFRTLKQNFNVTGQYSDEDKAYVEFKRLESKAILEEAYQKQRLSVIWIYPLYIFKLVVFDLAGLYATNPVRVMISMLVSYSTFSLIAALLILTTDSTIISSMGESSLSLIGKSFYYTAITFLTIGYGDYYPSGSLHWFAGIVGWVGLFLMSYFTVAFVRKVLR